MQPLSHLETLGRNGGKRKEGLGKDIVEGNARKLTGALGFRGMKISGSGLIQDFPSEGLPNGGTMKYKARGWWTI